MVPNVAQFKKLLTDIYRAIPDEDPTKPERRIIFSCVIAYAEKIEKMEKVITEVIAPGLAALMGAGKETAAASAPDGMEDLPPLRADVTASSPAATPPPAQHVSQSTMPVNGQKTVTVSAPQPIAPKAPPAA